MSRLLSTTVTQNPAPFEPLGQTQADRVRVYADTILAVYKQNLPSNYVSQTMGPYYLDQFQSVAEHLAKIQVEVEDAFEDSDFDFTRPEVLAQFLGSLTYGESLPLVDGDVTFRSFLKVVVETLLRGSRHDGIRECLRALLGSETEVRQFRGQFNIEVDVSYHRRTTEVDDHYHLLDIDSDGNGVTTDLIGDVSPHVHTMVNFIVSDEGHVHELLSEVHPQALTRQANAALTLSLIRASHILYEYRHLLRETFGIASEDSFSFTLSDYRYEDTRRYWDGIEHITGDDASIGSDLYLLSDPSRDFSPVHIGSDVHILTGDNAGVYRVRELVTLPVLTDPIPRSYTTSEGLSGFATIQDGVIIDASQDFSFCIEGETITFSSGPNEGTYRILKCVGANGGELGIANGPCSTIVCAPSNIRVNRRFLTSDALVEYEIKIDRLGVKTPQRVLEEDVSTQFLGSSGTTNTFKVLNGPLVKSWGSATPASISDVFVTVDGISVTISSVNPYTGKITLATPVALGTPEVLVSYWWMENPTFRLNRLNYPGLGLGMASPGTLRHSTTTESSSYRVQGAFTQRFPYSVVIGVPHLPAPKRVSHRFIAFDRANSSVLNDVRSLRLNVNPRGVSVPYARGLSPSSLITLNPKVVPTNDGWTSIGGVVTTTGSSIRVVGGLSYTYKDLLLPEPTTVSLSVISKVTPTTTSGVFSGAGFGFQDRNRLYCLGFLEINELRHVGMLLRPGDFTIAESWEVGPNARGEILSSSTVSFESAELPTLLTTGSKFQVLSGTQAGVYEITSVGVQGTRTTFGVTPNFPADYQLWGNRDIVACFEARWENTSSIRMVADTRTGNTQVLFSGRFTGSFTLTPTTPVMVPPGHLRVPTGENGSVFFGSFTALTTSTSEWSLLRFQASEQQAITRGHTVHVDMTGVPENDPEGWALSSPWGATTDLGSTTRIQSWYGHRYYTHTDITLGSRWVVSLEATVKASSISESTFFEFGNTRRLVRVGLLPYVESGTRTLAIADRVGVDSSTGLMESGWDFESTGTYAYERDHFYLRRESAESIALSKEITPGPNDRRMTAVMSIIQATNDASSRPGIQLLTVIDGRSVVVDFLSTPRRVVFMNEPDEVVIATTPFEWLDPNYHTYEVLYTASTGDVDLLIDGSLVLTETLSSFNGTSYPEGSVRLDMRSTWSTGSATLRLKSLSLQESPTITNRTVGIFLGGDVTDIDNWKIPRTDGTNALNSSLTAIPVPINWTSDTHLRAFFDPQFGAVLERPGVALPSGYADTFATRSVNPSTGWVVVENKFLPTDTSTWGHVSFGSLGGYNDQTWTSLGYKMFTHTSLQYQTPVNMVLNRSNTVNSGDIYKDTTPEVVVITPATPTTVSLIPTHVRAKRIFRVATSQGVIVGWVFNEDTQTITLPSSISEPVTVTFSPGLPVTSTYLRNQPLSESQTILNEGTPSFARGQVKSAIVYETESATGFLTPYSTSPGDSNYILNDPYRVRNAVSSDELYEKAEFFEASEGTSGLLSPYKDSLASVGVSGYAEEFRFKEPNTRWWQALRYSGGSYGLGGTIGPGDRSDSAPILYPSWPARGVRPGAPGGALNRVVLWYLQDSGNATLLP